MKEKIKQLMDKRNALMNEGEALMKKAEVEKRDLSDGEASRIDAIQTEVQGLDTQVARYERQAGLIRKSDEVVDNGIGREDSAGSDFPTKDLAKYSLLRALSLRAAGRPLDGIEAEMSQELAKRAGSEPRGFYVPHGIFKRDLNLTTGSGAKGTDVLGNELILALRPKSVALGLGVRTLTGLTGDVGIPKQTAVNASYWFNSENSNITTEGAPTVGSVGLNRSTIGAYTDISRGFLKQSSFDAEQFVRDDLALALAIGIDKAILAGSGSGAEPEGIISNGDVNVVTGGTLNWANVVAFETAVDAGNGLADNAAYVTTPRVKGFMKSTPKTTGHAIFLWEDNMVNGYRAAATNNVDATADTGDNQNMIFGDFSQVILGMWGGVDLVVDNITGALSGALRLIAMQDADVAIRHPEAFSIATDIQV